MTGIALALQMEQLQDSRIRLERCQLQAKSTCGSHACHARVGKACRQLLRLSPTRKQKQDHCHDTSTRSQLSSQWICKMSTRQLSVSSAPAARLLCVQRMLQ